MNKSKLPGRRKFLGDAAALGVLGALGASQLISSCSSSRLKADVPAFPERAPDGPVLRAGLIGCGSRGTGAAFNFLNSGPNLKVTALGDLLPEQLAGCRRRLRQQFDNEVADENCFLGFDAYQKVIDSDVDIIIEATLSHFRPRHFEAAIQGRKHVFVEKPGGIDPVGVRKVMAAGKMAEAAGLVVVSGTQRRHEHDYVTTQNLVQNGAIGDLVSANCSWNRGGRYVIRRQENWSDMVYMLKNQGHYTWITGDLIVNLLVHQVDVINWFFGKYPSKATGFGGMARRPIGDMYDYFSVDFAFDDGRHFHAMTREIDGCSNYVGETVFGTKGYTNCKNKIFDNDGNVIWEYQYPLDENGQPSESLLLSGYDQEHINFVNAIRTNTPINESYNLAASTLACIMGTQAAHTGRDITWDEMMNSDLVIGPQEYHLGNTDLVNSVPPIPGTTFVV